MYRNALMKHAMAKLRLITGWCMMVLTWEVLNAKFGERVSEGARKLPSAHHARPVPCSQDCKRSKRTNDAKTAQVSIKEPAICDKMEPEDE